MRSILFYLLALAAVAAGVRFGFPEWFGDGSADAAPTAQRGGSVPPVVVALVERRPLVDNLEALGTVRANESVVLAPPRTDRVTAIHFRDGMDVKQGDLLLELNVAEELADLAEAKAARDERQAAFDRSEALFAQEVQSGGDRMTVKAALDGAKARVARLEAAVEEHSVRAPFAGTLGLRQVSVGAYVSPATVITTLDDLSVVKVDFSVPETWLDRIQVGMVVKARSAAWGDSVFEGEIRVIDTRVDETVRAAKVRALLDNGDRRLKPGMLLSLTVERGEDPVLQVPEAAIKTRAEQHFVRKVDETSVARKVAVELGRRTEGFVEVLSGLLEGDQVVIEGVERVRDDEPVNVVAIEGAAKGGAAGAGEGR